MQIFLVGGAVRDHLLNLPVNERDWVVVGATPLALSELGYQQVGKDFPVFLHPVTGEEYALARTERKVGPGYRGFEVYAAPDVSLEDDLRRRDLTINAMAQDANGQIIDPYGGQRDLKARCLRHVSPAFSEDPVRILRVARFAACLHPLGFQVAPETTALMRAMVAAGEVDALVAERVWRECARALMSDAPARFFEVLKGCGALPKILPEFDPTTQVEAAQPAWSILQATLDQAASAPQPTPLTLGQRFAALCYSLEAQALSTLCRRLRVPNEHQALAQILQTLRPILDQSEVSSAQAVLTMVLRVDGLRRPERLAEALAVMPFLPSKKSRFKELKLACQTFSEAVGVLQGVTYSDLQAAGVSGQAFADALQQKRLAALEQWLSSAHRG